ncbi:MAG TPA: 2,3-diphosphoglycerate synthetase [Actinomycetota bacterium]|nr:2,3-diphosphoglycerate synthetase [Actinomycetota bacterium]
MRVLALVDGEHYPPTTRWGLATARALGYEVAAAIFVGGMEKVAADGSVDLGAVAVERVSGDPAVFLREAIARHSVEAVVDLSDEPVLGYRERMLYASAALAAGVRYEASDMRLEPPVDGPPIDAATLAVIGTGKRTGKTAVAGEAARAIAEAGMEPVLVAMGRGGPAAPVIARAGSIDLEHLVRLVQAGEHAASDYLEDAITTGVTTIGARRCGGGIAGRPFVSNVRAAAELAAQELRSKEQGVVILEGSGAAVPPVPWDAGVLVCRAGAPEESLAGYMGPYRVLRSDLVVFTMGASPDIGPSPTTLISHVRRLNPAARTVATDFVPVPLGDVEGKTVFFATTAPSAAGPTLSSKLEESSGCSVVGVTHSLGDRAALAREIDGAPAFDVLVTELKAAAVDVAAERASARGAEVVFSDNRPVTIEGDGEVKDLLVETARLAMERAEGR